MVKNKIAFKTCLRKYRSTRFPGLCYHTCERDPNYCTGLVCAWKELHNRRWHNVWGRAPMKEWGSGREILSKISKPSEKIWVLPQNSAKAWRNNPRRIKEFFVAMIVQNRDDTQMYILYVKRFEVATINHTYLNLCESRLNLERLPKKVEESYSACRKI